MLRCSTPAAYTARRLIPTAVFQSLIVALVLSRLDYCNSVLFGLPANLIQRLHLFRTLRCAAHLHNPKIRAYYSRAHQPLLAARPRVHLLQISYPEVPIHPRLFTQLVVFHPCRRRDISFRYGFTNKLITIQPLLDSATEDLFCEMKSSNHCLHPLLPPDRRTLNQVLRTRGHSLQLPTCSFNLHKKSFVISCLFKFLT